MIIFEDNSALLTDKYKDTIAVSAYHHKGSNQDRVQFALEPNDEAHYDYVDRADIQVDFSLEEFLKLMPQLQEFLENVSTRK